jgi:CheY-like chemotaxis protein
MNYKSFPIMLVEDDEIDILSIKRAFKRNNIINPVYVANNGEEAIEMLLEINTSDGEAKKLPGLMLLDINMPRMNGLELLDYLKKDPVFKTIPVIMLTSSADQADILSCYENSIAGYLLKPVQMDKFDELIRAIDLFWSLCARPDSMK